MEIKDQPNGTHTEQLKNSWKAACAAIDKDPKWVLKNVQPNAAGYYNPVTGTRAARRAQTRLKRESASNAEAGPSSEMQLLPDPHPEEADVYLEEADPYLEDADIELDYQGDNDDLMGPA